MLPWLARKLRPRQKLRRERSSPWRPQAKGWIPTVLSGKGMVNGSTSSTCSTCSCSSRTSQKSLVQIQEINSKHSPLSGWGYNVGFFYHCPITALSSLIICTCGSVMDLSEISTPSHASPSSLFLPPFPFIPASCRQSTFCG